MKPIIAALLVTASGEAAVHGDYIPDRLAAVQLLNTGNYQSAANAFAALALEPTLHEVQQADLISKEALCYQKLLNPTQAMTLAQTIQSPLYFKASRLELLKEGKKWDDIITLYGSENIELWPDKLIYAALMQRAEAYRVKGNRPLAELDYIAAVNNAYPSALKANAYYAAGLMYDSIDNQKALFYYGEVCDLEIRSGSTTQRSRIARARIFAGMAEYENALAEIGHLIAFNSPDPYWKCMVELVTGEITELQGNYARALTFYRAAAAVPGAPAQFVTDAQTKIAVLQPLVATLLGYKSLQSNVTINGDLTKTFWTDRGSYTFSTLRDRFTGETPTHVETRTSVRWIEGGAKLVVAIECIEPQMNSLVETAVANDSMDIYNDDFVELLLETPGGYRPAVVVNSAGVVLDECVELNPTLPQSYSVESVGVQKLADRWTVEIMINASALQAQIPSTATPWNFAVHRQRMAGNIPEYYMFSPTGTTFDDLRRYGHLTIKP